MLGMKLNSLHSIVVVFPERIAKPSATGADDPGNVSFPQSTLYQNFTRNSMVNFTRNQIRHKCTAASGILQIIVMQDAGFFLQVAFSALYPIFRDI